MRVSVAITLSDHEHMTRHRHQEFIKFLKRIDASTDPALYLHLIVDNYATHK
jgi:hypothetical protein